MSTCQHVDYVVAKTPKLFENVYYDTDFIPLDFDWGMKSWREKLAAFYQDNYGITINL
jgi:hypothetical protein